MKGQRKLITTEEFHKLESEGKALPEDTLIRCGIVPTIKAIDEANRTVEFTISDESVDRDQDTLAVEGWALENYRRNPVVLFAHNSRALPVAKAIEIGPATIDGARVLRAVDQFTPEDVYDFGFTVFRLVAGGYLNATSVGFKPIKSVYVEDRPGWGGYDFIEQELLEHSVVPVPSNPNALATAKDAGIELGPMIKWAEEILDENPETIRLMIPRATIIDVWKQSGGSADLKAVTVEGAKEAAGDVTKTEQPAKDEEPKDVRQGEQGDPKDTQVAEVTGVDNEPKAGDGEEEMKANPFLVLTLPEELKDFSGRIKVVCEKAGGVSKTTVDIDPKEGDEEPTKKEAEADDVLIITDAKEPDPVEDTLTITGEDATEAAIGDLVERAVTDELGRRTMAKTGKLPQEV